MYDQGSDGGDLSGGRRIHYIQTEIHGPSECPAAKGSKATPHKVQCPTRQTLTSQ